MIRLKDITKTYPTLHGGLPVLKGVNLHVREAAITQAWVVRKPSADGMITALECYDAKGEQLVQLFGKRKPGIPELEHWRAIIGKAEAEMRLA